MNIIEKYEKLCHKVVNKILKKQDHSRLYDDCMQEARIALLEAEEKFDESKGATFRVYAYCILRSRVIDYLASQRYPVSLSTKNYRTLQKFFAKEGEGFKKRQKQHMLEIQNMIIMKDLEDVDI